MLAMGLRVRFQAVTASTSPLRCVLLAILANYVLVPAVTLLLLYLFQANPMVSTGFIVLAVCPGAPVAPPITVIARGNVAWAVGIMVILAGLSAPLSPVLLSVLLTWLNPDSELHIDYLAITRALLVAQMLPLAVGMAVHHWLPRITDRIASPLSTLANLFLLLLVGVILATQYESLATIRLRGWFGMGLLFLASLGIGWLGGGPDTGTRKALAVTTASRNVAVALIIVTRDFANTPAVTAVVAYAFVSILGARAFGTLAGRFIPESAGTETTAA